MYSINGYDLLQPTAGGFAQVEFEKPLLERQASK